jgi:hypothetical protein
MSNASSRFKAIGRIDKDIKGISLGLMTGRTDILPGDSSMLWNHLSSLYLQRCLWNTRLTPLSRYRDRAQWNRFYASGNANAWMFDSKCSVCSLNLFDGTLGRRESSPRRL